MKKAAGCFRRPVHECVFVDQMIMGEEAASGHWMRRRQASEQARQIQPRAG
jgi:hypothetical protein